MSCMPVMIICSNLLRQKMAAVSSALEAAANSENDTRAVRVIVW